MLDVRDSDHGSYELRPITLASPKDMESICKDFSRGQNIVPVLNPMSLRNMDLLSITWTVAHIRIWGLGIESLGKGAYPN